MAKTVRLSWRVTVRNLETGEVVFESSDFLDDDEARDFVADWYWGEASDGSVVYEVSVEGVA